MPWSECLLAVCWAREGFWVGGTWSSWSTEYKKSKNSAGLWTKCEDTIWLSALCWGAWWCSSEISKGQSSLVHCWGHLDVALICSSLNVFFSSLPVTYLLFHRWSFILDKVSHDEVSVCTIFPVSCRLLETLSLSQFFFFYSLPCMNSISETSKRVTSLIIRRQFLKEKQRSQNSLFKFLGELRGCNEAQTNTRGSKHYSCINVLRFKILVCLFGMRCKVWTVMRESETFKAFWNQGMKGRYLGTEETR